jgi:hypothetical protein
MPRVSDDLWWAMPVLAGRLIRLEPLALEHPPGYLTAAGTGKQAAEVFRWMSPPGGALAQPVTPRTRPGTSLTPWPPGPQRPAHRRPAHRRPAHAARPAAPGPQRRPPCAQIDAARAGS